MGVDLDPSPENVKIHVKSRWFASCTRLFQVVKVQMQAKENLGRYTGVTNCASSLVQKEGPLALYKGLESHLWRNAVWNGTDRCLETLDSSYVDQDTGVL